MKSQQPLQYPTLISQIGTLLEQSRNHLSQQVNTTLIKTYRSIGHYIVEYEQWWADRAIYWSQLLNQVANDLTIQYWKWFSYFNINFMRNVYLTFPNFETLSQKSISWSHLVFLSKIKDKQERDFYLIESSQESRSLRELKRQFNSWLFERLALSTDKDGIMKLAKQGQIITKPTDGFKDPYILEFLWLDEKAHYSESDLEKAIIDNLEYFLLELGKGFAFIGRQKRFTAGDQHFFVDLVFYHRFLKCFVLIDLKIGELTHQDIGQMQMYVNRYDAEYKSADENKTIWLILCKVKNDIVLQYTLPEDSQIFTKEYKLYLPEKDELQHYLEQHLHTIEKQKDDSDYGGHEE